MSRSSRTLRARWIALSIGVLASAPQPAEAHLFVSGMGPLYDGFYHVVLTPEDLMPVVVLGLLSGVKGPAHGRTVFALLPLAWIGGGAFAMAGATLPALASALVNAGLLMGLGLVLAANIPLSVSAAAAGAVTLGVLRGLTNFNGVTANLTSLADLAGAAATAAVLAALAATLALQFTRPWVITVFRVGGSWLAAFGLLLAGWALRAAGLHS